MRDCIQQESVLRILYLSQDHHVLWGIVEAFTFDSTHIIRLGVLRLCGSLKLVGSILGLLSESLSIHSNVIIIAINFILLSSDLIELTGGSFKIGL